MHHTHAISVGHDIDFIDCDGNCPPYLAPRKPEEKRAASMEVAAETHKFAYTHVFETQNIANVFMVPSCSCCREEVTKKIEKGGHKSLTFTISFADPSTQLFALNRVKSGSN